MSFINSTQDLLLCTEEKSKITTKKKKREKKRENADVRSAKRTSKWTLNFKIPHN